MAIAGYKRAAVTVGSSFACLVLVVAPAAAHVEVKADKTTAGATGANLTFVAESESETAGIVSLRVKLPEGVDSADVSYISGPTGWSLRRGAGEYTVSGPAVTPGEGATYTVRLTLPRALSVTFPTLQGYSDGHLDRWIERPTANGVESASPAPALQLTGAAAGNATPTSAPSNSSTAAAAQPQSAAPASNQQQTADDSSTSMSGPIVAVIVAAALIGTGYVAIRRRRERS